MFPPFLDPVTFSLELVEGCFLLLHVACLPIPKDCSTTALFNVKEFFASSFHTQQS